MIRLAIFEDNDPLRSSLVQIFSRNQKFCVSGAFPNVQNVYQNILVAQPDVVLLDIEMPGKNGITAIPVIKDINPETVVIMYTQFEDDDRIFASLRAGADGYILKKTPPEKLFSAIEEVMLGGAPLTSGVAKKILAHFRDKKRSALTEYNLTLRENEVLQFLVKGYAIKKIGEELCISYHTTRTHMRNIYKKLQVNCGKEAIAKLLSSGIPMN